MTAITEVVSNSNQAATMAAAIHCRIDAAARSKAAIANNEAFFNYNHLNRIAAAKKIVNSFFTSKDAVYVNHRTNRGKPFSVVKVSHVGSWPTSKDKQKDLYQPLAALGMFEVRLMKNTNSYNFRIR